MSLSAVLDKGATLTPALPATGVTCIVLVTDSIAVTTSSATAKADPAVGRGLTLGNDYYPDGTGGFQQTVPGGPAPAKYGLPGNVWPAPVASQSRIFSLALDPISIPVVTRASIGTNGALGSLAAPTAVRTAVSFVVQSLDATGGLVGPAPAVDNGEFDFVILSPNWS